MKFQINDFELGNGMPPRIIVEISGNHRQKIDRAYDLIDSALGAGARLLKFQLYTADSLTMDVDQPGFLINSESSLWAGRTLHDLYSEGETPWEWYPNLQARVTKGGGACFSSVFDEAGVAYLESCDIPAYKVASQEIVHVPLLKEIGRTGKPVILSTGMASLSDIDLAVSTLIRSGSSEYALMKCSSAYPAPPKDLNLSTISVMKKIFDCPVGFSDHTLGIGAAIAAVAQGADMVEKHLTISRDDGAIDSQFSMEPGELETLVKEMEVAYQSIGSPRFGPCGNEIESLSGRRSVYFDKSLSSGTRVKASDLRVIRPNGGLPPECFDSLPGMILARNVERGEPASWECFRHD